MKPLLVVTNAAAGSNEAAALEAAVTVLREEYDVTVTETGSTEELDEALVGAPETVVVAGGDGSLHAVVNALSRARLLPSTVLGLLPLGTGNDFARGVGIPLEADAAARLLIEGGTRHIDLLVAHDGTRVVNGVHLGVGADAGRAAEQWKPRLGRFGYAAGAVVAGLRPKFLRVSVRVDGQAVVGTDRRVSQVAIGNGSTVGGGTELTPEANPGDGSMDVMVSFAVSPLARLGYVARLARGRHHERADVAYVRGTSVEVRGEGFWTSADGELSGPHHAGSWRLEGRAMRMVLP